MATSYQQLADYQLQPMQPTNTPAPAMSLQQNQTILVVKNEESVPATATSSPPTHGMAIGLFCMTGIIAGTMFGVLLPSLKSFVTSATNADPPGLNSTSTIYALIISMFSAGEFIGSNITGILAIKHTFRYNMLLMGAFAIGGTFCYSMMGPNFIFLGIIGRLLTGIASGGWNVSCRAYIACHIPKKQLTITISSLAFVMILAMMVSPGLESGLAKIPETGSGVFRLDAYRTPNWLLFVMSVVGTIVLWIFFGRDEQKPAAPAPPVSNDASAPPVAASFCERITSLWDIGDAPLSTVLVLLLAFFTFSFGFTVVETMMAPIMSDHYGLDVTNSSVLFMITGLVSAATFALLLIADKCGWIHDSTACLISLFCFLIGAILMIDYRGPSSECGQFSCPDGGDMDSCTNSVALRNSCLQYSGSSGLQDGGMCVWNADGCSTCAAVCLSVTPFIPRFQLYAGFVLFNVQCVLGRVTTSVLYSKFLQSRKQSWMQSLIMSVGTFARFVGPILGMSVYEATGRRMYALMLTLAAWVLFVIIFFLCVIRTIRAKEVSILAVTQPAPATTTTTLDSLKTPLILTHPSSGSASDEENGVQPIDEGVTMLGED